MDIYALTDAAGNVLDRNQINDLLEEIGISQTVIDEGSSEAVEEYATKNKIDLTQLPEMAKKETDNKVSGSAGQAKGDYEAQLKALGIPDDVVKQGNDAVVAYAEQNGIQLPKNTVGTQLNLQS